MKNRSFIRNIILYWSSLNIAVRTKSINSVLIKKHMWQLLQPLLVDDHGTFFFYWNWKFRKFCSEFDNVNNVISYDTTYIYYVSVYLLLTLRCFLFICLFVLMGCFLMTYFPCIPLYFDLAMIKLPLTLMKITVFRSVLRKIFFVFYFGFWLYD